MPAIASAGRCADWAALKATNAMMIPTVCKRLPAAMERRPNCFRVVGAAGLEGYALRLMLAQKAVCGILRAGGRGVAGHVC